MTRKIICVVLIPFLLIYLTGCYRMYDLSKEDLKTTSSSKLWIMSNNGDSYLFREYRIKQDTLLGEISNENRTLIQKTIPLKDISALQIEKLNGGPTVLAVLGIAVVLVLIGALITGSGSGSFFKNTGHNF